jgi:3-dehydroquinate synthase
MKEFRITGSETQNSIVLCGDGALDGATGDFVFTDGNVLRLYKDWIAETFPGRPVYAMPAGEEYKTPQTLFALLERMAGAGLTRKSTLVCLGGGVVGDIGGLASALYMRGIGCVQIPTTLLAQVDSSVGGKTAVDFCGVKNLVGSFKQPDRVLADARFLKTLPPRELRCGLGEIVKHAALDGKLFDTLAANASRLTELGFLAELVPENIAIKAEVVQKDAKESGLRQCLNLGHTTGHAFELTDGALSHGEYVLIGIAFEAELAKGRTQCDVGYLEELQSLAMRALGGMPALPSAARAAELARLDKKNHTSAVVVVTAPVSKGKYALLEIPFADYCAELAAIQEKLC